MKPKLKPPGTKRLKLKYQELLSRFGFKYTLRRYAVVDRVTFDNANLTNANFFNAVITGVARH